MTKLPSPASQRLRLPESSLAPSGRGYLHEAFVWENLTHSFMNHGHLSSVGLSCCSQRPGSLFLTMLYCQAQGILQWLKPGISTTSFAGEVGFWLLCFVVLFPMIVPQITRKEILLSPRLRWQLNKHTDNLAGRSYRTRSLANMKPNDQHF